MKKLSIITLFSLFFFMNSSWAQNPGEIKHIHVIVKPNGGETDCLTPNISGEVELGDVAYVTVFDYYDAISSGCGVVEFAVYRQGDTLPSQSLTRVVLTPPTIEPSTPGDPNDPNAPFDPGSHFPGDPGENHGEEECSNYEHFTIDFSFSVFAECFPGESFLLPLEYRIEFSNREGCEELMFPAQCYPDDEGTVGHGHGPKPELLFTLRETIQIECCPEGIDGGPNGDDQQFRKAPSAAAGSEMILSPNPFSTDFTIETEAKTESTIHFDIFDGNNRLVYSDKAVQQLGKNQYQIDGSSLANGFYYLRIKSGDQVSIKRLVKIQ